MHNLIFIAAVRNAYLACALEADWPEEYTPRTIHDCAKLSVDQATADIMNFIDAAVLARIDLEEYDPEYVGYDLWLTRCGHGVGFWNRPKVYGAENAEKLTVIAIKMGTRYPYPISGRYWGISS